MISPDAAGRPAHIIRKRSASTAILADDSQSSAWYSAPCRKNLRRLRPSSTASVVGDYWRSARRSHRALWAYRQHRSAYYGGYALDRSNPIHALSLAGFAAGSCAACEQPEHHRARTVATAGAECACERVVQPVDGIVGRPHHFAQIDRALLLAGRAESRSHDFFARIAAPMCGENCGNLARSA